MKKNVILIYGGAGSEHEISKVSAGYLSSMINKDDYHVLEVEIRENFEWFQQEHKVQLNFDGELVYQDARRIKVDVVIPCIHGYPGETGDLQSYLEMIKVPYLGSNSESGLICFNKILTKLWLDKIGVPTTEFIAISSLNDENIEKVNSFFDKHSKIFVKAASQGSSVGCYPVVDKDEIASTLEKAFTYSDFVLIEKNIIARELEVSAFEYQGKIHITSPGEIICPDKFYSFEEKYDQSSHTSTIVEIDDLDLSEIKKIKNYASMAFKSLKLRDLSRIDFFYTVDGEILLNEINTFPGMTPISMFPKMMENYGVKFEDFISDRLARLI